MAESIKGWCWPACCSPPLSALPVPSQSGTQKSYEKYFSVIDWACLAQLKQPNPTQLAPSTGSSKRSQVFGRISALIWPRSASDWGVLAVCARLPPKSLETRVHKTLLCSFGHSTFTSITFDMIQRNLIQPCFKGRFIAFFKNMFLRKWGFLKHISPSRTTDSFDVALMSRVGKTWAIVSHMPETSQCCHCRVSCGSCSVDIFSKLLSPHELKCSLQLNWCDRVLLFCSEKFSLLVQYPTDSSSFTGSNNARGWSWGQRSWEQNTLSSDYCKWRRWSLVILLISVGLPLRLNQSWARVSNWTLSRLFSPNRFFNWTLTSSQLYWCPRLVWIDSMWDIQHCTDSVHS